MSSETLQFEKKVRVLELSKHWSEYETPDPPKECKEYYQNYRNGLANAQGSASFRGRIAEGVKGEHDPDWSLSLSTVLGFIAAIFIVGLTYGAVSSECFSDDERYLHWDESHYAYSDEEISEFEEYSRKNKEPKMVSPVTGKSTKDTSKNENSREPEPVEVAQEPIQEPEPEEVEQEPIQEPEPEEVEQEPIQEPEPETSISQKEIDDTHDNATEMMISCYADYSSVAEAISEIDNESILIPILKVGKAKIDTCITYFEDYVSFVRQPEVYENGDKILTDILLENIENGIDVFSQASEYLYVYLSDK